MARRHSAKTKPRSGPGSPEVSSCAVTARQSSGTATMSRQVLRGDHGLTKATGESSASSSSDEHSSASTLMLARDRIAAVSPQQHASARTMMNVLAHDSQQTATKSLKSFSNTKLQQISFNQTTKPVLDTMNAAG